MQLYNTKVHRARHISPISSLFNILADFPHFTNLPKITLIQLPNEAMGLIFRAFPARPNG